MGHVKMAIDMYKIQGARRYSTFLSNLFDFNLTHRVCYTRTVGDRALSRIKQNFERDIFLGQLEGIKTADLDVVLIAINLHGHPPKG